MPPDVAKRLDDKKAMLLVRGHYGVVLDKLNFYAENRFREVVAASEAFKKKLIVPAVSLTREWPLFKPKPMPGDPDPAWSDHRPESAHESRAARAIEEVSCGAISVDVLEDLAADRAKIARNGALAFEDGWRLGLVVDEAMRAAGDEQAAMVAFNLRTRPEVYGVLKGSRGLFGWDRYRIRALFAVSEIRRDVLAMRHAIRERRSVSDLERETSTAEFLAAGDAILAATTDEPATGGDPDRPLATPSDGFDQHGANIQRDQKESSVVAEMVAVAEKTLASAAESTDSTVKKAELARIGHAFAHARASLSEEDRRENMLAALPPKRNRTKGRLNQTADGLL
jgi:type IV secretion system protein VirD4